MKYLDAKRKLIFMMATVKYLKLYFENKTTITDDDINTLVVKSLPLVFKDYAIRTEDITEITGKIKSLVINFKNSENKVITKSYANIETIVRETIEINDYINLEDAVDIIKVMVLALGADDSIITDNNINTVYVPSNPISINKADIKSDNEIKLIFDEAVKIAISDKINTQEKLNIANNISSTIINIRNNIKTDSYFTMDLIQMPSSPIKIDDDIFIKDLVEIANIIAKSINVDSKTNTSNNINLLGSPAKGIDINNKVNTTNNINIFDAVSKLVKTNELFKTIDSAEFLALYSDLVKVNDLILSQNDILIKVINSNIVSINEGSKTSSFVDVFISHFLSLPIELNTKLYIVDNIKMNIANVNYNINLNKETSVKDILKLNTGDSLNTSYSCSISIKDYLTIKRVKYTILRDIDNMDLNDVRERTMSEIIYMEY